METIIINVLRTTLRNDELFSNKVNDSDILPFIWRNFKIIYPFRARVIENVIDESTSSDGDDNVPVHPPTPQFVLDN